MRNDGLENWNFTGHQYGRRAGTSKRHKKLLQMDCRTLGRIVNGTNTACGEPDSRGGENTPKNEKDMIL